MYTNNKEVVIMNIEPNPVKEAEVFIMQQDRANEVMANDYAERMTVELNSLKTFKSFLWDINTDDSSIQAIHGCQDGDMQDKAFAYDILMNMFEEYCEEVIQL